MMENFVIWIKHHSGWLYEKIYENQFFFIDYWSFAHLWSGFVLFTMLLSLRKRNPFLWLLIYLSFYEIFEIAMLYLSLHVFQPETIKDQFTDIFVGMIGGILSYLYINQKANNRNTFFEKIDIEALFVAETISFLWVDRSQFFFFQPEGAVPLSVLNYLWRILLGYLLLRIYACNRRIDRNVSNGLQVFLLAYFTLFILTGFQLGIYTFSKIFNIHFNTSFFVYQMCYPFITILFYEGICYIFESAAKETKSSQGYRSDNSILPSTSIL